MISVRCGAQLFPQIEAILFDKDGTLANVQHFLTHLSQQRAAAVEQQSAGAGPLLLRAFGLGGEGLDPAGLMAVGTRGDNQMAAAVCLAMTGVAWASALALARTAFEVADRALPLKAGLTPPFSGIVPLLQRLTAAGLKLGIVSSDSTANVQDFVHHYNLQAYLAVQLGHEGGASKPDPAGFLLACDKLGSSPAHTLMVGDSLVDIQMGDRAQAAGCVGVVWGWPAVPNLAGASVVLTHPEQIQPAEKY